MQKKLKNLERMREKSEHMSIKSFLLQLTKEDFFEFISSMYDTTGFKVSDLSIVKLPVYDESDPPKIKVVLKRGKKSIPEPMTFYFYKFNYEKDIMLSVWNERFVISSVNEPWRAFMTKKFGNEYVEAYSDYVSEYIRKERFSLEKIESECDLEVENLKSLIAEK